MWCQATHAGDIASNLTSVIEHETLRGYSNPIAATCRRHRRTHVNTEYITPMNPHSMFFIINHQPQPTTIRQPHRVSQFSGDGGSSGVRTLNVRVSLAQ